MSAVPRTSHTADVFVVLLKPKTKDNNNDDADNDDSPIVYWLECFLFSQSMWIIARFYFVLSLNFFLAETTTHKRKTVIKTTTAKTEKKIAHKK